ncbi:MAG: class I SAM-dependent methyltransferase [Polyangia bacterium]
MSKQPRERAPGEDLSFSENELAELSAEMAPSADEDSISPSAQTPPQPPPSFDDLVDSAFSEEETAEKAPSLHSDHEFGGELGSGFDGFVEAEPANTDELMAVMAEREPAPIASSPVPTPMLSGPRGGAKVAAGEIAAPIPSGAPQEPSDLPSIIFDESPFHEASPEHGEDPNAIAPHLAALAAAMDGQPRRGRGETVLSSSPPPSANSLPVEVTSEGGGSLSSNQSSALAALGSGPRATDFEHDDDEVAAQSQASPSSSTPVVSLDDNEFHVVEDSEERPIAPQEPASEAASSDEEPVWSAQTPPASAFHAASEVGLPPPTEAPPEGDELHAEAEIHTEAGEPAAEGESGLEAGGDSSIDTSIDASIDASWADAAEVHSGPVNVVEPVDGEAGTGDDGAGLASAEDVTPLTSLDLPPPESPTDLSSQVTPRRPSAGQTPSVGQAPPPAPTPSPSLTASSPKLPLPPPPPPAAVTKPTPPPLAVLPKPPPPPVAPPKPAPPVAAAPAPKAIQAPPPPVPNFGEETKLRKKRRSKQWFEEIFDDDYLHTLPFMTPQQTEREVAFLLEALQLPQGGRVLDIGCGYGRHAMEIAARGYKTVGLDLSLPLLIRATDAARRVGVNVDFVHGDMRDMTFDGEFDGAYSFFTTFGYFDDDTNRRVATGICKALRPGGRLVLDLINRDYLIADLPTRVWWQGDGCVVLEEVDFNYFTSRLQVQRQIIIEDGRQLEQEISIRAYSLHEIGKVLHHAGFRVIEVSGGLDLRGRFYGNESRQLLVVAEKKPPE